jgi:hypothetical protein
MATESKQHTPEAEWNEFRQRFHALSTEQCVAGLFYALGGFGRTYPAMFREVLEFAEQHNKRIRKATEPEETR